MADTATTTAATSDTDASSQATGKQTPDKSATAPQTGVIAAADATIATTTTTKAPVASTGSTAKGATAKTATATTAVSGSSGKTDPTATAAQQPAIATGQDAADGTADATTNASGSAGTSPVATATVAAHDHAAGMTAESSATASANSSVQATGAVPQQLPSAAINTTTTASLTATAATHAAVPLSGLAVEIAASAKNGKSSFEIRLDPADLGRIDVRIDVDRNGQMTSHLTVEKPETLSMLQQDAPQLQRALDNAGFKTGDGGLQFSLRDQSSSGQNSGNDTNRNAQRLVVSNEDTVAVTPAGRSYGRMLGSSSGVDISV